MDQRVLITAGASADRARDRGGLRTAPRCLYFALWCACDPDAWSRQLQVNHMAEAVTVWSSLRKKRVSPQRRCYVKQSSCVLVFDAAGLVLFAVSGDGARTARWPYCYTATRCTSVAKFSGGVLGIM